MKDNVNDRICGAHTLTLQGNSRCDKSQGGSYPQALERRSALQTACKGLNDTHFAVMPCLEDLSQSSSSPGSRSKCRRGVLTTLCHPQTPLSIWASGLQVPTYPRSGGEASISKDSPYTSRPLSREGPPQVGYLL